MRFAGEVEPFELFTQDWGALGKLPIPNDEARDKETRDDAIEPVFHPSFTASAVPPVARAAVAVR